MKREYYLIVFALSIGVILFFFSGVSSNIKNFPPKNGIIIAFGDSLIEGYGSTTGNDFVSLLSQKLKRPIVNMGMHGYTSAQGLARINEVVIKNPGTVIVLFGGNDYLQNIPQEQTFANLNEMIQKLQSSDAFVILLGVRGGLLSDHYESSFEKLSSQMGVVYVPNVLSGLFGDTRYMSDVVHPNDVGYSKIADKVYGVIKDYVW